MELAIILDIHGNLVALRSVLDDINSNGIKPEDIICAGDVALMGVQGPRCLRLLQRDEIPTIKGNTDRWIADYDNLLADGKLEAGSSLTRAVEWTRNQLGEEAVTYLGELPPQVMVQSDNGAGELQIVHGTPRSDEEGFSDGDNDQRLLNLAAGSTAYAIIGAHTHRSFARMVGGTLIANSGSVGRSYEGRAGRATYLAVNDRTGLWHVEIRQVYYDNRRAYREIQDSDLPLDSKYAESLLTAAASAV
jgi:predicted phosphodiesterase